MLTDVPGQTIDTDVVWDEPGVYRLTGYVTVVEGGSLTIGPDVAVVQSSGIYDLRVNGGRLVADGATFDVEVEVFDGVASLEGSVFQDTLELRRGTIRLGSNTMVDTQATGNYPGLEVQEDVVWEVDPAGNDFRGGFARLAGNQIEAFRGASNGNSFPETVSVLAGTIDETNADEFGRHIWDLSGVRRYDFRAGVTVTESGRLYLPPSQVYSKWLYSHGVYLRGGLFHVEGADSFDVYVDAASGRLRLYDTPVEDELILNSAVQLHMDAIDLSHPDAEITSVGDASLGIDLGRQYWGHNATTASIEAKIVDAGDNGNRPDITYDTPLPSGHVSGVVWTDADGDGYRDHDESGRGGVRVEAYRDSDRTTVVASGVTDGDGRYSFTLPGTDDYALRVDSPSGWTNNPASLGWTVRENDFTEPGGFTRVMSLGATGDRPIDANVSAALIPYTGPQTFIVSSTADSGTGSLRQAILDANATDAADEIAFELPAGDRRIRIDSPLPYVTRPVVIDGTTQAGWDGEPLVEVAVRSGVTLPASMLLITSDDVTVRGLAMTGRADSALRADGVAGLRLQGNWFGLSTDRTTALTGPYAVELYGVTDSLVGTDGDLAGDAAEGNVIVGSTYAGLRVSGAGTRGVRVAGNRVGHFESTTAGYGVIGVWIDGARGGDNATPSVTLGGDTAAEENHIGEPANESNEVGVRVSGSDRATVQTNRIGGPGYRNVQGLAVVDADNTTVRNNVVDSNGYYGVAVLDGSAETTIEDNLIVANGTPSLPGHGVWVFDDEGRTPVEGVTVRNNLIIDNEGDGVRVELDRSDRVRLSRNTLTGNRRQIARSDVGHAAAFADASLFEGELTYSGTVTTTTGGPARVEFFAARETEGGEPAARFFLGERTVDTAAGIATTLAGVLTDLTHGGQTVAAGWFLTATVTGPDDQTSPLAAPTELADGTPANEPPAIAAQTFFTEENSPNSTLVGTVAASDPDEDTLSFAITGGNTGGAFRIDAATGQLRVNNSAALDFEATPVFELKVTATDNGTPNLSATATVRVELTDVNEAPVVSGGPFDVNENSAGGTFVGQVAATDPEGDDVTFAITQGNVGDAFQIDPATGRITVRPGAVIDYETRTSYSLRVRATDNGDPARSGFATVRVDVNDLTENAAPTLNETAFSVDEDEPVGALVGTVTAADPDDPASSLRYAIVGGNAGGAFSIEAATGRLRVDGPLDADARDRYELAVRVTDPGNASDTGTVVVEVTPAETRNRPPSVPGRRFFLDENAPGGTVAGAIAASDPDGDPLTYFIQNQSVPGTFTVDRATGQVRVASGADLDYEARRVHFLDVLVRDDGNPALSGRGRVYVELQNVNEAPSVEAAEFTIPPAVPERHLVGRLDFSDPDRGDRVTLSIAGSNTGGAFTIEGRALYVANPRAVLAAAGGQFRLLVRATDGGGLSRQVRVLVNVGEAPRPTTPEDILSRDPRSETLYLADSTGSAFTVSAAGQLDTRTNWGEIRYADFDGDGDTDFVARDLDSGDFHVGLATDGVFSVRRWAANWGDVTFYNVGDFNGDGRADIVGEVPDASGFDSTWRLGRSVGTAAGGAFASTDFGPNAGRAFDLGQTLVGDFNGDGVADRATWSILESSWLIAARGRRGFEDWDSGWDPAMEYGDWQVADFDGDGRDDIAGWSRATGDWRVDFSDGTSFSRRNEAVTRWNPNLPWRWITTGDFDGDGDADLVGKVGVRSFFVGIAEADRFNRTRLWASWPTSFPVVEPVAGDFNGDGIDDVAGFRGGGGKFHMLLSNGLRFGTEVWEGGYPVSPFRIDNVAAGDFAGGSFAAAGVAPALAAPPAPAARWTDAIFEDRDEDFWTFL